LVIDSFAVRPANRGNGISACLTRSSAPGWRVEQEDWETFSGKSYVSKFSHSGVAATFDMSDPLRIHGFRGTRLDTEAP